jgi:chromosome segregation ATPase
MSWVAIAFNSILKVFRLGGGAEPQRVDFESVTEMWELLSKKLSDRVTTLENNLNAVENRLDECRKSHHGKFLEVEKLQRAISECRQARDRQEIRIKHLEAEIKTHRGQRE